VIVLCVALLACPVREAGHPTRDDTSEPAEGGTGAPECEAEVAKIKALEAKIEALEAELEGCRPQ
jgi:hypothetical protein